MMLQAPNQQVSSSDLESHSNMERVSLSGRTWQDQASRQRAWAHTVRASGVTNRPRTEERDNREADLADDQRLFLACLPPFR